jgi:hypothetical protein
VNESILGSSDIIDFQKSWRTYLLEWEGAKHYHFPYLLYMGRTNRNLLLDQLLLSLLFLRAASILDEGLKLYIEIEGIPMPRSKYRDSLQGRISVLSDAGVLNNSDALHSIRKRRNDIAHDAHSNANWDQLKQDLVVIETSLQKLGLVGIRPHLEYYGLRSEMHWIEDPEILGERDFRCGVKENGIPAMEFSWKETLFKKAPPSLWGYGAFGKPFEKIDQCLS